MKKTLYTLGMASLLMTGVAATGFAAGSGAQPSQSVTESQTGSQQLSTPATGAQVPAGNYGMSTTTGVNTNTAPGSAYRSAQSNPDAAHPTVPSPSGGGGSGSDNGGGSK